jgi:UDP-glucose:(heptosyl)LPS alpha-1,3-glucosyltransferase
MKIAFIVHDYHRAGGHSRYVAELAERFSQEHEVHVYANTFASRDSRMQFHHIAAWRYSALTTILTFLPRTRRIGSGFDLIHAQGLSSLESDVVTTHICNRAWFEARKRFDQKLTPKDRLFDAVISPLEKRLYSNPESCVIAISEKVRRDLSACYGRTAKVHVLHHGVDVDHFTPANKDVYRAAMRCELGLGDSEFVFLFVGDIRKGAAAVIESMARARRGKLVLVTHSPADSERKLSGRLGVSSRVIFRPATAHVERYYAAADAFVFPTPYDAFGMVIAEALACGLPVITSSQAGAAEWITPGVNGIILDNPADSAELANVMSALLQDRELGRNLGVAARETAEHHSWDSVARCTMHLYETVVAERRK